MRRSSTVSRRRSGSDEHFRTVRRRLWNPAAHGIVRPNSRTQILAATDTRLRYSESPIRDSAVRFIAAISLTAHICPMTLTISDMVLIILLLQ